MTEPVVCFVFPQYAGHVNPALALARRLVERGCRVEFCSAAEFKEPIEDTGAVFSSLDEVCGASASILSLLGKFTAGGFGLQECGHQLAMGSSLSLQVLPKLEAWLKRVKPAVVVYCPVVHCGCTAIACQALEIPCVSLMTTAGPGYLRFWLDTVGDFAWLRPLLERWKSVSWVVEDLAELRARYERPELNGALELPIDIDLMSPQLNLVTTIEELGDGVHDWHQEMFDRRGIRFRWVGPLLPPSSAMRAGAKPKKESSLEAKAKDAPAEPISYGAAIEGKEEETPAARHRLRSDLGDELPINLLKAAHEHKRKLIFVSMGTVVTSMAAWGRKMFLFSSLTGKEICQSVYRTVFEMFGDKEAPDESEETSGSRESYLIIVAVGKDRGEDALEGIEAPGNAICRSFVPQLEVLAMKPAFFITHGGQNSVTESLLNGVPMVVVPGVGDQFGNAAKVEKSGFGVIAAPPPLDSETDAATFQRGVKASIEQLMQNLEIHQKTVDGVADRLRSATGVNGASDAVLEVGGIELC